MRSIPKAPVLFLALLAAPVAQAQPSFDCRDARSQTERAICASPDLAQLELRMAGVYEGLVAALGAQEARRIADIQLERRQSCGADAACIERQLLTSIGVFRAEAAAAGQPAQALSPEGLSELRAALGRETAQAGQTAQTAQTVQMTDEDDEENDTPEHAAARRAGLEAGFARLPDYRRRHVQGRLRDAGLLEGAVDGVWGEATARGLEAFLQEARTRGFNFPVQREEGAVAALRFVGSDIFYYEFLPQAAR